MNCVTGAFGYTGKYITRELRRRGEPVITLTGHPRQASEFSGSVKAYPFQFDNPAAMAESMAGVKVLYNTYWVRFDRGGATHSQAVTNTRALLQAAELAGVERVVHISITNPDRESKLPYFRGKAHLEDEIRGGRFSHAIVRPTVVFGDEDILINNIAYLVRKSPVFLVPGRGDYRLQPVYVEDLARIAVDAGTGNGNLTLDAVGPEVFTFEELVRLIAATVGSRAAILRAPPRLALFASRIVGTLFHDVVLTSDELAGLMANLLISPSSPAAPTRLSAWLREHASSLGVRYASELRRHYAPQPG